MRRFGRKTPPKMPLDDGGHELEPGFLLHATDPTTSWLVRLWILLARLRRVPRHEINAARAALHAIRAWRHAHPPS